MGRQSFLAEGIVISYLEEKNDADKTIFFFHGNSSSANYWYKQYASPLFKGYRLVAFDLPGHGMAGGSLRPTEDYSVLGLGRIMAIAVEKLSEGKPYVLVGLSLGTNVVAEIMTYNSNQIGIALISTCIVGGKITLDKVLKINVDASPGFVDAPDTEALKTYLNMLNLSGDKYARRMFEEDFGAVKAPFRSVLSQSISNGQYSDEIDLLQKQQAPILLVFGKEEQLLNINYLNDSALPFWHNKIFIMPSAGHLINIDQPEAFNQLLADFLESIFE